LRSEFRVSYAAFGNWGEPLLHPQITDTIAIFAREGAIPSASLPACQRASTSTRWSRVNSGNSTFRSQASRPRSTTSAIGVLSLSFDQRLEK
jgi:hypothetical protein